MPRIHFFLLAICLLFLACKPEEIIKPSPPANNFVFGGEGKEAVFGSLELPDGNILLIGSAQKPKNDDYDLQLTTISPRGEEIMVRDYRNPDFSESGQEVIAIPGGYAIAGYQFDGVSRSAQIKLWFLDEFFAVSSESTLPPNVYTGSAFNISAFYPLTNGGYLIGHSNSAQSTVLVLDNGLNLVGSSAFPVRYWDPRSEFITPFAGGFMAASIQDESNSFGSEVDFVTTFFDENGNEQWANSERMTDQAWNAGISGFKALSDGSLVATIGQDISESNLLRVDSVGSILSSTPLGASGMINLIRELPSGNLLLGGNSVPTIYQYDVNSSNNLLLMEVDNNDQVIWNARFGGRESDTGNDLLISSSGSYIFSGISFSYGLGESDNYVVIYNR